MEPIDVHEFDPVGTSQPKMQYYCLHVRHGIWVRSEKKIRFHFFLTLARKRIEFHHVAWTLFQVKTVTTPATSPTINPIHLLPILEVILNIKCSILFWSIRSIGPFLSSAYASAAVDMAFATSFSVICKSLNRVTTSAVVATIFFKAKKKKYSMGSMVFNAACILYRNTGTRYDT